ncbi:MAG: class I SAM-dependent methyltransferase [Planctomycetota bacterium]|nr:class I SAM-dependent methyltransferase [Planctomycetota bacterium]MDA1105299.1 class I SAM-dependent methyltransferase [Planctomycetota bacterium]
MQSGAVELRLVSDAPGRGVTVDFSTFRGEHLGRHSLVRAIGKGSGAVIDATAGLGADAWLIAASGRRVIALERCAAVHAVLADGLARARADPSLHVVAQRITLHQADSIASLERVLAEARAAGEAVDAIFVDPMYPHSDSSALPPRDIRLVRAAAGDDTDADQLFAAACGCGTARVVVRRPHRAPPMELPSGAPVRAPLNAQFKSTLVRYDLYLPVRVSREA